jgi:phosphoribosylanthranilate isomerase
MLPSRVRIKICCIASIEEARTAIRIGADAIGLVAHMPSGPGVIDETTIQQIAAITPPPIGSFLLTSEQSVDRILAQHRRCRTNTIQIVDRLESGTLVELKSQLPGIALVQVIHVADTDSIEEAMRAQSSGADAILLDSGNPNLPTKVLGGTGRVHDWNLSRQIRERVSIPVFLAGGLSSENVCQAIETVQPFGIDLCSSVRTNGVLDAFKLSQFVNAVAQSVRF